MQFKSFSLQARREYKLQILKGFTSRKHYKKNSENKAFPTERRFQGVVVYWRKMRIFDNLATSNHVFVHVVILY